MPISHENKYIFVHLTKTGGTSVEVALGLNLYNELFGFEDQNGVHYSNSEGQRLCAIAGESEFKCLQHLTAFEIKKRYPEELWKTYFKFTFVRNPWDLAVSQYNYVLQHRDDLRKMHEIGTDSSFEDFVEIGRIVRPQCDAISDENGNIIVDFIGKFEYLEEDFRRICEEIGIEAQLPKVNVSKRGHYRDYYNDRTKKMIRNLFRRDIEVFGYTF